MLTSILPLAVFLAAAAVPPAAPPKAAQRMLVPGPEEQQLQRRAGSWDVTVTFRAAPDAPPAVTTGLVAERTMVGSYLQEVMHPGPGSSEPDFRRLAFLYFSRVEGRWQYVSMDTRLPVGIMPAASFGRETGGTITFQFESLGFVGLGPEVEGRLLRSNLELTRVDDDHDFARQRWIQADGTGREWLALEYEFKRRR